MWDLYFSRLRELLLSERGRIEQLIEKKAEKEITRRWQSVDDEGIAEYIKASISFIEERLYAYSLDHLDRFLKAVTAGVSLEDLASTDLSLSWYDWREEKEEIDARIGAGLNIMLTPEDIVDDLIDEFGAFPNKSIMQQYPRKPEKNYLPDYALAAAIQQVIQELRGHNT